MSSTVAGLGSLTLFSRAKHLFWQDAGYPGSTGRHWSTYGPQFEAQLPLTEKTSLVGGQEGDPGPAGHPPQRPQRSLPGLRPVDLGVHGSYDQQLPRLARGHRDRASRLQRFDTGDLDVTNRTLFMESYFGW